MHADQADENHTMFAVPARVTLPAANAARPVVFNLGVAKSGTMSLREYFKCNRWRVSHDLECGRTRCSVALSRFLDKENAKNVTLNRSSAHERFKATTGNARPETQTLSL